jgi:hypothetical protein
MKYLSALFSVLALACGTTEPAPAELLVSNLSSPPGPGARGGAVAPSASVRAELPAECTWTAVAHKAQALRQLQCEWDSAGSRSWGGQALEPEVSVSIRTGAGADEVARRIGALSQEAINPTENAYVLTFSSVDAAIDSVRPLICDPDVRWASMVTLAGTSGKTHCQGSGGRQPPAQ